MQRKDGAEHRTTQGSTGSGATKRHGISTIAELDTGASPTHRRQISTGSKHSTSSGRDIGGILQLQGSIRSLLSSASECEEARLLGLVLKLQKKMGELTGIFEAARSASSEAGETGKEDPVLDRMLDSSSGPSVK